MRFKKIYVEIQNSCNLQCSFCIQNSRNKTALSVNQFTEIVTKIRPYTDYIYLHVLGEPLMHPHLAEFLEIAAQADLKVNITTNGTLLMKKLDVLLNAKSLRQINVSVHSFSEHEQPDYLMNIANAAKLCSAKGIYVSLRFWNMANGKMSKQTLNQLNTLLEYLDYHESFDIKKGSIRIQSRLFINFEEVFEWPSLKNDFVSQQGKCLGWKNMCAILSDGTVVPCCLDSRGDVKLGNIFSESMEEIFNKPEVKNGIDLLKQGIIKCELCQRCSYRTRFDN